MIELFFSWLLATGTPAPIVAYRCVVRDSATKDCVLWYDPETKRFFDKNGLEQPSPW